MKKGFALIYTLLFVVLLMVTVSATWFTGLANLRLSQRSEYSVQARQLAQAAIDDGWVKYKDDLLKSSFPLPSDSDLTFPTGACATPNPTVHRIVIDDDGNTSTIDPDPSLQTTPSQTSNGAYDYKICTGSGGSASGGETVIEGIGYYKGNKITLKADVSHEDDEEYCSGGSGGANQAECQANGGTWKINHDGDTLTINQTGPSK